ncbi:hypothetical protein COCNU_02G019890 [Cocos nucifera]|uniref:Uncharacterized protein n=1 Tax=Cocos nucifera TaxID=13894 RepID=A0A8K0I1A1_COCNU|nr:hypothetical protein COCNU_02G019890 [Cocos nucifera]
MEIKFRSICVIIEDEDGIEQLSCKEVHTDHVIFFSIMDSLVFCAWILRHLAGVCSAFSFNEENVAPHLWQSLQRVPRLPSKV